jgi:hypothetical protein
MTHFREQLWAKKIKLVSVNGSCFCDKRFLLIFYYINTKNYTK